MTEEQVTKTILTAVEKNFPKDCSCCGHLFHTYKDYLEGTTPLATPISYDAEIGNWQPQKPLGFIAYWKCNSCSNTLTTNLHSLETETIWQLLTWLKKETKSREVSRKELLESIRAKMRKQVLGN
jgi:hypothetical protein